MQCNACVIICKNVIMEGLSLLLLWDTYDYLNIVQVSMMEGSQ